MGTLLCRGDIPKRSLISKWTGRLIQGLCPSAEPSPNRNLSVFWRVRNHSGSPMLQETLMTRHTRTTMWTRPINALRSHELGAAGPSDPTATSQVDSLVFSLISSLAAATNITIPKKATSKAIVHKCLVEAYYQIERKLFELVEDFGSHRSSTCLHPTLLYDEP